MKFRRSHEKRKVRATLDMTPLIDVVFLLVLFFMMSSTFVSSSSIPIEMTETPGLEEHFGDDLSITLTVEAGGPDGEGKIFLNDMPVEDWATLSTTLAAYHEARPDRPVTIRPDRNVPTGRTVKVLGLVTSAGIQRFYIAAEQPQGVG